jgi:DNA-binding response OmpR family regulator
VKITEEPGTCAFASALSEDAALLELPTTEEAAPATDVVTEKNTVLIIEDDEAIRHYLSQLFAGTYIVLQAPSGEAGLEMAQQYLPDLIISDIHMKALSGIELCKQIKEQETTSHIPVILLTGSTSDALKLQGIEEGADDYISKPFDSQLLTARVSSLLRTRSNLQKYFYNEITLHKSNLKISPEYKEFLEKCITIVERHLEDENFTVKNLLAEMSMSHSTLFRKVKSISGLSVNVFIRFIRLRKAAELFVSTDYNVNETAFMVGIKDAKYFREQFNKLFKMNPSEYIKKYRGVYRNQFTFNKPKS